MKDLFQRTTTSIIVSSVIAFILGLVMAIIPGVTLQAMSIAIGIFMIIYGVALIVLDFMSHHVYIPFYGIMSGLLSVIAGIVLIAMPNVLTVVFAIALGLWIILSSVNIISVAITVRGKVKNWGWWLLLGIIDLICGIIILFNPFASSISLVVLGGIIIMIHSVITIVDMVMIKNDAKELSKALEETVKGTKEAKTSK